ncbi:SURF1 family protein [Kineococcus rhizosphaerae]|uniref:SURF1-like protein n=1 Tax=Kineococcus rhizosphaerae TaxID=559628 RepID=A0A2T0R1E8_9ACTN|nr:SURF1 family protein [Kineococcus rhizosphaerae]PRY13343.1 cytochrome oxidase assembly protein ShyY1 [Kineococcus rhizosphaerae]
MHEDRRSAPTGRVVGLTLAALLVVAVCAGLGVWQWHRGNVVVSEPPARQPVVPVSRVVDAGGTGADRILSADEVGHRVEVTGTFDPAVNLLVPGRALDGVVGSWVLGVVVLADGSGVPVVRGWVPTGQPAPDLPPGAVDLTGVVQPPESSDIAPSTSALPAGQTWIVSAADLVNRVDYAVANAYVTQTTPAAGLKAVPPADAGQATRRLDLRNLAYAGQWWVFALFAVVVWFRAVRDERRGGGQDDPDEPAPGTDEGPVNDAGGRDMSGAR